MFLLLRTQLSASSNRLRRLEGSQSRAEDSLELMQESHDRLEELCERLCEQQKIDLATSHSRPARRERKGSFVRSGSGSADRLLAARFTARASSQPNLLAPINRGGSVSAVQGQSSVADVHGLGGGDSTSNRGGGGGGGAAPAVVPKRMATGGAVKLKLGLDEYLERVRRKCRERALACEVGNHPIYSRVRWNRMDEVMRLLDEGFDINEPDDRGNTVLHIACQVRLGRIETDIASRQENHSQSQPRKHTV